MAFVAGAVVVLALVGIDQLTKYLVLAHIADGVPVRFIPEFIQLRYVQNTGAAFSMFSDKTWLLSVITAAIIIVAVILLLMGKVEGKGKQISALLIIAGGLGNLIDRVFRHFVVDFLEFTFMDFAVFNFADICVTIGAAILIIILLIEIFREPKNEQ